MTAQTGNGTTTAGNQDSGQLPASQQTNISPTAPARGPVSGRNRRGGKASGPSKANIACRFYTSKGGCRAGDTCPYLHDPKAKEGRDELGEDGGSSRNAIDENESLPTKQTPRTYQAPTVAKSKVVSKPVTKAQLQNPRKFQIDQLKRRFNPEETTEDGETILNFRLNPSDPDFPFELDGGLHCRLHVPKSFPKAAPHLDITNPEMGRGFQVNVERGFDELAQKQPSSSLLGLINSLDRQLESLLSGEKANTIKIVRNSAPKEEEIPELEAPPPSPPPPEPIRPIYTGPKYTAQQLAEAETKRKADVRQLEARLGKLPLFEKASDGLAYMVPVEPRRRDELPVPLQNIKSVELTVPRLYPLEPSRIRIFGVQRESAEPTEFGFLQYVRRTPRGNLLGFLNYLSSSMHILATTPLEKEENPPQKKLEEDLDVSKIKLSEPVPSQDDHNTVGTQADGVDTRGGNNEEYDDRTHLHFIPRPPEWSMPNAEGDESDSDSESSWDDTDGDYDEEANHHQDQRNDQSKDQQDDNDGPERGILLSFPFIELHGIELLELTTIALTVRCLRCKDTLDIDRIRNEAPKLDSCKKCAQSFGVTYRRELIHANSVRAGYLDMDGCTVSDLLPSKCSTAQPPPGIVSVRGESATAICRECHSHMSFKIPEIKFLRVSSNVPKNRPPPRRKQRENLGVTAGTELPNRGRCEHYRKSYRWFRFSCCNKVHPCDRCHDATSDHPTEHANRMLCGWCSREQLYRPETCAFCRNPVIGKRAGGFWEGGKGTRDKNLMSRKDPRKWKRRAGGVAPGHNSTKK